jgi:branched-chain amino acid transport system permease protein
VAGALLAFLKGSVFPNNMAIPLSVDALVMVLLGGIETISGAIVGAVLYKLLSIWLISQTDLSKLVLGGVIVLLVSAFPRGIVGFLGDFAARRRPEASEETVASPITAGTEAAR